MSVARPARPGWIPIQTFYRWAMNQQQEENVKRWRETMEVLLRTVGNQCFQPYSITVVPEKLRKVNQNAYAPMVVSIGPRYKGRMELQKMEEIKRRFMMSLLARTKGKPTEILETCLRVMLKHDAAVRESYVEEIKLGSFRLATIMVYDGCFLLELLISRSHKWNDKPPRNSSDPGPALLGKIMLEMVLSDLTLLDNQIPLFVLHQLFFTLFKGTNVNDVVPFVEELALSLFGYSYSQHQSSIPATHFLELIHQYIFSRRHRRGGDPCAVIVDMDLQEDLPKIGDKNIQVKLDRCATRLQAAGVRFKGEGNSAIPISDGSMLHIKFEDGVLEIPSVHITETTEAKWRNFIVWEHHKKKWNETSVGEMFSFTALLFNDLICCASDVQLLKDKGIIVDDLSTGNHKLVAFFRSLTSGLDRGIVDTTYSNIIRDLNNYSVTYCWVKFLVMYWHSYSRISEWIYGLHKFLKRGYNFAAALVTLLTLVQTIYTVLSYHRPN